MTALHIAKRCGVWIFAIAGSEQKRDYLLSLGAHVVAGSHDEQFAATPLTAPGGQRMGVILNSLAGCLLDASLTLLTPLDCFLELGSKDIVENKALPIRFSAQGGTFIPIDSHVAHGAFSRYLQQIIAWIDNNTLPSPPHKSVPLPEAAHAFAILTTPQHVDKVVVTHRTVVGMDWLNAMIAERCLGGYTLNMSNAEAMHQLWPILNARSPQVQLLFSSRAIDRLAWSNQMDRGISSAANDTITQQTVEKQPRPEVSVPYSSTTREVECVLCQILEEYLGLNRVGIDDNYTELEAASLDMVQLSGQVARHYPQVNVVSLYSHVTMYQLATSCRSPEGESNASSPQPVVQTNAHVNQITKYTLQIAKNTARSHTSLY